MKLAAGLVIIVIGAVLVSFLVIAASRPTNTTLNTTNNTTGQKNITVQWERIGPANISYSSSDSRGVFRSIGAGKINAFAQNYSDPSIMYAAGGNNMGPTSSAGAFKSVNGGKTWFQVDNGLSPIVNALLIDKSKNNIILAGTGTGVYLSSNGAASWQLVQLTASAVSGFAQINSSIYAAVGSTVIKSADDGKNWTTVYSNPSGREALSIASAGDMLYIGLDNGEVISHRAGANFWNYSAPVPPPTNYYNYYPSLSASQSNPDLLYVSEFSEYGNTSIIYRSTDGGVTWTIINISNEDGNFTQPGAAAIQVVAVDPLNSSIIYAGGDLPLFKSTDGGKSFSVTPLIVDTRMIEFYGEAVVVGSDQGLYRSMNGGVNWTDLNGDILSSITYSVGIIGSTFLATMQDYSPVASFDGGRTWESLWNSSAPGGEGGILTFDPYNSSCMYFNPLSGTSYSTDGGYVFKSLPQGIRYLVSLAFNRSFPNEVFGLNFTGKGKNGANNYLEIYSTNCGKTWNATGWPATGFQTIFTSPLNPDLIFASNASGVYYTEDSWRTITKSSLPLSNLVSTDVVFDPVNSSVILATVTNATGSMLLRSADGGKNFYLTNGPSSASSLEFAPHSEMVFTLGQPNLPHLNLYESVDGGAQWELVDGNMTDPTGIAINGTYVYVSTEGEGIIRAPLSSFNASI